MGSFLLRPLEELLHCLTAFKENLNYHTFMLIFFFFFKSLWFIEFSLSLKSYFLYPFALLCLSVSCQVDVRKSHLLILTFFGFPLRSRKFSQLCIPDHQFGYCIIFFSPLVYRTKLVLSFIFLISFYGREQFNCSSWASQVALVVMNTSASAGDTKDISSIPGSGRSPGGGNGNSFQYSYLKNSVDRGAWQVTVHRVAKSWT